MKARKVATRVGVSGTLGGAVFTIAEYFFPYVPVHIWVAILVIGTTIWSYYKTYWSDQEKHNGQIEPPSFKMLIPFLLGAVLLNGCVHGNFSERITAPDTNITSETSYSSTTFAFPFTKIGEAAHKFSYAWGGKGKNKIEIGQDAKDVDSTEMGSMVMYLLDRVIPVPEIVDTE